MKIKSLAGAVIACATLATASLGASAAELTPVPAFGPSFNVTLGSISITSLSNLTGSFSAASSIQGPGFSWSLQSVSFTSGTVGSLTHDLDPSASGFSFHNVAAGNYLVQATGTLSGLASIPNLAVIGANYTVTPVPEPETFAMLLVGLGLMGAIARRRNLAAS